MSTRSKPDYLYQLVDSMTKSEKRYFKLQSKLHVLGAENKYMHLYDLICEHSKLSYREREHVVKTKFKEATGIKRYDLFKANLYHKITRSLEWYHSQSGLDNKIHSLMAQAKIFSNKCLFEQAMQKINRAKALCSKNEKWYLLLELLEQEREINYALQIPSLTNEEERLCIERIENVCQYRTLQSKFWSHYIQDGLPTTKAAIDIFEKLGNTELLHNPAMAVSQEAQLLRLYILQFYHGMILDLEKTNAFGERIIALFDNTPKFKNEKPVLYIRCLINLQYAKTRLREADAVQAISTKCVEEMETLNLPIPFYNSIRLSLLFNEYDVYAIYDNELILDTLINKINDYFTSNKEQITQATTYELYWYNAINGFIHLEYHKALEYLNLIVNTKSKVKHDIQTRAKILILIVHFELGNMRLLRSFARNTSRMLNKKNKLDEFEMIVLKFIERRLLKFDNNSKALLKDFEALKMDLTYIEENSRSHAALKLHVIFRWVQMKLEQYNAFHIKA